MALYQVVEQNGQKSLIDVASGGGSVAVPAPYNTEAWITESGTWTAPVTGDYGVLLIGGGNGGVSYKSSNSALAQGGYSGIYMPILVKLIAGTQVPITIGVGGQGRVIGAFDDSQLDKGGDTAFGEYSTSSELFTSFRFPGSRDTAAPIGALGCAAPGGGFSIYGPNVWSGYGYGAGGSAIASLEADSNRAGVGKQGAIRIRYYDPNKTSSN